MAGRVRRWFLRMWWRKHRPRTAVEKGFLGLRGLRTLRLKPIGIWIFDGIGNRLIPARDFFLEKKQKRARCSGLPSRFILCRTCRAKAACLGGVSVCIPRAAARHTLRVLCGILEPGSGPAHARIGAAPRGVMMRGGQMQRLEGRGWCKHRLRVGKIKKSFRAARLVACG